MFRMLESLCTQLLKKAVGGCRSRISYYCQGRMAQKKNRADHIKESASNIHRHLDL